VLPSPVMQSIKYFLPEDGRFSGKVCMVRCLRTHEFHHHRYENLKSLNISMNLTCEMPLIRIWTFFFITD
jgi:hypothetical protein